MEGQSHREKLGRSNQEHEGKPIRIFLEKTLIEQLRWNKNTWYMYGERIEDGGRGGEWEWGWGELRVGGPVERRSRKGAYKGLKAVGCQTPPGTTPEQLPRQDT